MGYWDEEEDDTIYKVVVNHEEQYSIWPVDRENPLGWRDEGKSGSKQECLQHIEQVWTDMRPLSLRKKMEQHAAEAPRFNRDRVAGVSPRHFRSHQIRRGVGRHPQCARRLSSAQCGNVSESARADVIWLERLVE